MFEGRITKLYCSELKGKIAERALYGDIYARPKRVIQVYYIQK